MDTDLLATLVRVVFWFAGVGFVVFLILYIRLARAWRDPMGRHVVIFTAAIGAGILYALLVAPSLPMRAALVGWIVTGAWIAGVIWWRVAKLVRYQIEARREEERHDA